ncbi:MAG TPA: fatty acid desaturase [Acidimicrobiales bacterium]|nr:fatty acid desaturase [Acidimicrobiales bacterium]
MPRILLAVVAGLATCQVAILITTVFLHRALAHRALRLTPGLRGVFRVLTWMTTGIRPRQWVAVHRKHHAYTDVAGDPHSPVLVGWAAVQFGNLWMYRRVAKDDATVARYARDLPADRWDRVLFDHALLGLSIGIALLCLTLGWQLGLIAAGVHTVSYLLLNAAVNAVGHTRGRRPHGGHSGNSQWLAWLTAGEGLHNNHHAAPTSARLAQARWEIDPGWWFIRMTRAFGWLAVRHGDPRLVGRGDRVRRGPQPADDHDEHVGV